MYNRYLASAEDDTPLHINQYDRPQAPQHQQPRQETPPASVFSDLTKSLSGRLQNIKLDMDTILVLVIVWFLLSDGKEIDWDQLLMIGALLILGI